MTSKGIAQRLTAKYGPAKAWERAIERSWLARFDYRFGGEREDAYYLVRWTFWDSVALIAQRQLPS